MSFALLSSLLALVVLTPTSAQTIVCGPRSGDLLSKTQISDMSPAQSDCLLAARAIAALKTLRTDVVVYNSLNDFTAGQRLVRVSPELFDQELHQVIIQVEGILPQISSTALSAALTNALDSFRDGAFWWHKSGADQRVIAVTALAFAPSTRTPSESFFQSAIPYTVAVHWRQAERYLNLAEKIITKAR